MYEGPDLPSTDLPEDHSADEPQRLPLDVTKLQTVSGYENAACHTQFSEYIIATSNYV